MSPTLVNTTALTSRAAEASRKARITALVMSVCVGIILLGIVENDPSIVDALGHRSIGAVGRALFIKDALALGMGEPRVCSTKWSSPDPLCLLLAMDGFLQTRFERYGTRTTRRFMVP